MVIKIRHSELVDQFSMVVREPKQNLPSGSWVSKGWEPLDSVVKSIG